ncbi:YbhB/YbcL family Raf kinase inhibitor-like protein [Salinisphaera sp.]|uniref:YbhB/YbcL family Raf kinase inhibitor-like protein n=1 Tax=Salinisphaera sp. TaxID=1914330 RepID=UPI002D78C0A5|nr:YbhB/YbcL family Raf kinase inhibitor-like protein [Salinisphaera sp.]HET7314263.1 YbhB/YbcL family Raf kinase inhibitor-like protein [Salinisphaera sp.]
MKRTSIVSRSVWVAAVLVVAGWVGSAQAEATFTIKSPAFDNGQPIPKRFSCDGGNTSPPLTLSGVPGAAKSLALIVDDPDAPGSVFTHWVLYNLAPSLVALAPGASDQPLPGPATTADNSTRHANYHGMCPPPGDGVHHYHFKLFALDRRLPSNLADKAAVLKAMQGHVIAQTEIVGTYQRP